MRPILLLLLVVAPLAAQPGPQSSTPRDYSCYGTVWYGDEIWHGGRDEPVVLRSASP